MTEAQSKAIQLMSRKLLASYKRERKMSTQDFKVLVLEAMCSTMTELMPPTEREHPDVPS